MQALTIRTPGVWETKDNDLSDCLDILEIVEVLKILKLLGSPRIVENQ